MSEVKTYEVNCNDAWLNTDGDDISGSYVKYADYMALATKLDLAERACAAMAAENAMLKQRTQQLKAGPVTCCRHHETILQVHPFEQLMSHPPQPKMYCPECEPSIAEWVARSKQEAK